MNRKLAFVINLGVVLALVLAVLPLNSVGATTMPNPGFKLITPKTEVACHPFAKVNVTGRLTGVMVEYTFYSWASGSPVVIATATSPLGEPVRFEYPGGVGNGQYSVVAVAYDAAGQRIWKKGAKWVVTCEKVLQ